MKIAALLNVHANPELVCDTIDSIRAWCSNDIVAVVDKKGWSQFEHLSYPDTHFTCGVYHGARKGPYKNFAIGMIESYKRHPNADWYLYTEFDCLFISDSFKEDLNQAARQGRHFACIDWKQMAYPRHENDHWVVKEILQDESIKACKCLGCLMFFSKECIKWLHDEVDFFNKVLEITSEYQGDYLPNFHDYAIEEVLFPTAASMYNNPRCQDDNVYVLNKSSDKYLVTFCTEVTPEDVSANKAILHPMKQLKHPLRLHFKKYRDKILRHYAGRK